MKKNILKILVAYHKPFLLLKSNVYTPIHVGRKLAIRKYKDGKMPKKNYMWLRKNLFGDNRGENLSLKNLELGESSATYWAWKNYEKLGNPEYIGLMHYRRIFNFGKCKNDKDIENFVQNYDFLISKRIVLNEYDKNNYNQYKISTYHHIEDFDKAINALKKLYPEYSDAADKYLNLNYAYFCNMYIMKRDLFFKYCEWLFSILELVEPQLDLTNYCTQEKRLLGYIAERLTGIFYTYMVDNCNIKTAEIPIKQENEILNSSVVYKLKLLFRKLNAIYQVV